MSDWHLNKNVPIMFLLALGLQFIYFVNFISTLDSRIITNEKEIARQEARLTSIETIVQAQAVSLGRIDENIRHIRTSVDRVLNQEVE